MMRGSRYTAPMSIYPSTASSMTSRASAAADTHRARFNPLIRSYLVISVGFSIAITVIGLPIALLWFLGLGQWWARHYFDRLECQLDERELRYRKGILVQVEKTIPLENIQDVTFIEGPLLRHFHLSTLKFETAGHSANQANDMKLTGIIDAQEFRNRILEARDALKNRTRPVQTGSPADASTGLPKDALRGIEARLDEIISLLRERR